MPRTCEGTGAAGAGTVTFAAVALVISLCAGAAGAVFNYTPAD